MPRSIIFLFLKFPRYYDDYYYCCIFFLEEYNKYKLSNLFRLPTAQRVDINYESLVKNNNNNNELTHHFGFLYNYIILVREAKDRSYYFP